MLRSRKNSELKLSGSRSISFLNQKPTTNMKSILFCIVALSILSAVTADHEGVHINVYEFLDSSCRSSTNLTIVAHYDECVASEYFTRSYKIEYEDGTSDGKHYLRL